MNNTTNGIIPKQLVLKPCLLRWEPEINKEYVDYEAVLLNDNENLKAGTKVNILKSTYLDMFLYPLPNGKIGRDYKCNFSNPTLKVGVFPDGSKVKCINHVFSGRELIFKKGVIYEVYEKMNTECWCIKTDAGYYTYVQSSNFIEIEQPDCKTKINMTQELKNKIITIAEYDDWVKEINDIGVYCYQKGVYNWVTFKRAAYFFKYHTSDEWLMPVARKVYKEMQLTMNKLHIEGSNIAFADDKGISLLETKVNRLEYRIQDLRDSFTGTTADLFNSVYNAIELLNTLK